MIKEIKRWGNSLIIRFNPDECKIYDINEGDLFDLSDINKIQKKEVNK